MGRNGAAYLAQIADMLGTGGINSSTCRKLVQILWENDQDPAELVERENLAQIGDENTLVMLAEETIREQPKSAQSYREGKTAALQALVGQMMRKTAGRGNPTKIQEILKGILTDSVP